MHICIGACGYIQAYVRTRERERRKERKRMREPLPFPLTTYPPPLLDRERKKERKEEMARAREERNIHTQAAKELSAILFYLSRLLLDRIHRFLTLALSPGSPPISRPSRRGRERSCVRERNAKCPEIFVCASLCNYSSRLL